jgi:hypothetical protein
LSFDGKAIDLAEKDKTIQGFADGVFYERNSQKDVSRKGAKCKAKTRKNCSNDIQNLLIEV